MVIMPRFLAMALLTALLVPALHCQTYTLEQLIDKGLQQSTSIHKQELTLTNSNSLVRSAYQEILPDATASAYGANTDGDKRYNGDLSISKSISLDEPTYFDIKTARLERQNAKLTLQATRKQVAYDVFTQYLDVLNAQKTLHIERQNLELQTSIHDQTQIQNRIGRKTELDLRQSEIDLVDARIGVQDAQSNLRKLRENLFRYLGVDDEGFDFTETDLTPASPDSTFSDPIAVIKQKNEIQSAGYLLRQSKLQFIPNTSLSFSYDYSNTGDQAGDIAKLGDYDDSYTLMLKFSYPLFSVLNHGETHRRMVRSLTIQQADLADNLRQAEIQQRQLLRDWSSSRETYDLAILKKDLSEANLTKAQEEYRLGRLSLIDLDKSRITSLESQKTLNERYYALLRSQEEVNLLLSRPILGKY
jgi:outer membrane protein